MKSLQKNVLIFSAIFHIIAVFFSEGFHRPDEYLGIFQWMQFKLGDLPSSHLSWEFGAQIRPWAHPYLFAGIISFCKQIGLINPFYQATLLRFLAASLGMLSLYQISKLIIQTEKSDQYKKIALIVIATLWFLPFIHARTTAENFSMSFFVFGYYLLNQNKFFRSGLMLGLSFIFRFQMIFMIAPFILWHLFFNKIEVKKFATILIGGVIVLILSTVVDYFGYGNWVFTPYNYFYQNIIMGVSSHFGVDPWWKYFDFLFFKAIPPISILFLFCTIYHWISRPFSLYSFSTIPFFIIHSIIGHKELRFLFPMSVFLPFLMAETLEKFPRVFKYSWKPFVILSVPLIIYSSFAPAHSPIEFYKYLFYEKEPVTKIYTLNFVKDQLFFYQKNPVDMVHIENADSLKKVFENLEKPKWFLTDRSSDREYFVNQVNCASKYQSYSPLMLKVGAMIGQEKRWKMWTLFRCN